ncbi:zinc finger protein 26 isoform X2 [Plutella xylostella]|uniref:zinc finger protein 26 isoform X2 n=1 Tax=Plutella xylostella TaxID=51655 RepID=UPI002032E67C|nr:zinc finger protein 26 isoform X2 [Plutella xylostella]
MIQACVFCLSQDRNLSLMEESLYLTVYPSFKGEYIEYISYLQAERLLKLCWECRVKACNFKKLLQTAQRSLNSLKLFMEFSSGDLPKSESNLHITTVEAIDIAPTVPLLNPVVNAPKLEQNIDDVDFKFIVEPSEIKDINISLGVVKLEDTLDIEDSNFNNDTYFNNDDDDDDSEDDKPLAVRATALAAIKRKRSSKKALDSSRTSTRKSRKKKPPTPAPPKFSKVWASSEQAMRWHREELRRAREASLSFVHECDACERLFADEEELNRHVGDAHSEEAGQYTCDVCLYRFPDQTKLQQHMEAHYINYKCKNCSFESRILAEMQKHVDESHSILLKAPDVKEVAVCNRCKNEFISSAELKAHLATCRTYKCVDCDQTFPAGRAYHQHRQKHRLDPDGIYCEVCKIYYKATWYKKHLLTSLKHVSRDSFKYECEICHQKFPSSSRLKLHMFGYHKRLGPFPCELCPKSFFNRSRLTRHCASVHKIGPVFEKEKNKMCETCGKGFSSNHQLANHLRTHTGERPWRCEECPAAFAQNGSFYMHMKRMHGKTIDRHGRETRADKVCCDVCGKEFSARCTLKVHYDYYHLKKTKFHCDTCDKYCRSAADLRKHANTHASAARAAIPCDTCGKTFKTRGAHTQHMKKHGLTVVERPFKCRSCDAAYSVRTNLYQHYKVKHLKLKRNDRITIKNLFNLDKEIIVLPARK